MFVCVNKNRYVYFCEKAGTSKNCGFYLWGQHPHWFRSSNWHTQKHVKEDPRWYQSEHGIVRRNHFLRFRFFLGEERRFWVSSNQQPGGTSASDCEKLWDELVAITGAVLHGKLPISVQSVFCIIRFLFQCRSLFINLCLRTDPGVFLRSFVLVTDRKPPRGLRFTCQVWP